MKNSVPLITCAAAAEEKVYFLDARPAAEFNISHLPDARRIGYEDFQAEVLKDIAFSSAVIVYCSVGVRSEQTGEKLIKLGYKNVRNLEGGIFQWANEGRVLKRGGKTVTEVHPYNQKWGKWVTNTKSVYQVSSK